MVEVSNRGEVRSQVLQAGYCGAEPHRAGHSKGSGTLRLSGILDFEGAQAADPLMDLAKTLYCYPDADDAKRAALLDGYGEPARKDWRQTVELYYLYFILEFWCWMAPPRQCGPLAWTGGPDGGVYSDLRSLVAGLAVCKAARIVVPRARNAKEVRPRNVK